METRQQYERHEQTKCERACRQIERLCETAERIVNRDCGRHNYRQRCDRSLALGTQARDCLVSQGITTVTAFFSASRKEIATVLAEQTEYTFFSARNQVSGWKRNVRQRLETRKEQPVGLHPAFEVFTPEIRSFFTAMSIATPEDLLNYEGLAPAYMNWRRDNKMGEMNLASARGNMYLWKESVTRQGAAHDTAAETAFDTTTFPSIIAPASTIVSGTNSPPSSASPQEPFGRSQSTFRDGAAALTVDDRPMSRRLRRKIAKRTFPPVLTPASTATTNEQEPTAAEGSPSVSKNGEDSLALAADVDREDNSDGRNGTRKSVKRKNASSTDTGGDATVDHGVASEILLLGPYIPDFLAAQGITTIAALFKSYVNDMATALAKDTGYTFSSAQTRVYSWKRDARQRLETRMEQPVGLHPAFEVFSPGTRSFFTAMSIATPDDLFQYEGLWQAYMNWRRDNKMTDIAQSSANMMVSVWRRSVRRQSTSPTTF